MKNLIKILLLLVVVAVQGQETVSSAGGEATGIGGTSSFTIGQLFYSSYSSSEGNVSEGVQYGVEVLVESVSVTPESGVINIGETQIITANILPNDATNKNVTWTSSDETIATVDASGVITGQAIGTVEIFATTVDGEFVASAEITVGITLYVKRLESSENPKAHLWSKETGVDKGITDSSAWPSNLPNMTAEDNGWFSYTVTNAEVGILFVYDDKKTTDFKYFNENRWILLDANGSIIGEPNLTNPEIIYPAESVTVAPETLHIPLYNTAALEANVLPVNTTNKNVLWSSNNDSIATVDTNGVVTGIAIGEAIITATTEDGDFTASANISVYAFPVEGITTTSEVVTLEEGKTQQINVVVLPENASNKNVIWSSSDEAIATVDAEGFVTAIEVGEVLITATTEDGGFTTSKLIDVVELQGVTFRVKREGSSENPKVHLWSIETGSEQGITDSSAWPSNLPNMTAEVDGWYSYFVPNQEVGILFIYTDKKTPDYKYYSQDVWIMLDARGNIIGTPSFSNPEVIIPVESIELSLEKITIEEKTTLSINATVLPNNASNKNVIWVSSDESVAMVNSSGTVTALFSGETIITATTEDGSFSAAATIEVTELEGITIHVKRQESSENPRIHIWSKATGTDKGVTNSSNWPSNLPYMNPESDNWFSYKVTQSELGVLFVYVDKKTSDFKYYNKDIWILLDNSGSIIGTPTYSNPDVIVPVEGIDLPSNISLSQGTIETVTANVLPENASNQSVMWFSNNPEIASINNLGELSGVTEGNTFVTATTIDGNFVATMAVEVTEAIGITIHVKRQLSLENPLIHVWSNVSGTDQSITDPNQWPNNLPNMVLGIDGWFNYTVDASEIGVLFIYQDKKTPDYKYYSDDIWVLLDENGEVVSITDNQPFSSREEVFSNEELTKGLIVVPNPVVNRFSVEYITPVRTQMTVSIFGFNGQLYYSESTEGTVFKKEFNVNSLRLGTGIYIVQVQSFAGIETKKIIVN